MVIKKRINLKNLINIFDSIDEVHDCYLDGRESRTHRLD